MRDLDRALARIYRDPGPAAAGSPVALPRPEPAPGSSPTARPYDPPSPHFRQGVDDGFWSEEREEVVHRFRWPATVTALEEFHGDRFQALADRLVEERERRRVKVLLFTSCQRAEGRTTIVLALARTLALRPGRVAVVDADLSGPMVARHLDLRPEVGLDDVVTGGLPLADAITESRGENLAIVPLREPVSRPKEFLASPGWACTLARLRREFDMVLLDGSPLFAGLSAAMLHRSVDAAVLVQNPRMTGERNLLRAREVLEAGGIPLLGVAQTCA